MTGLEQDPEFDFDFLFEFNQSGEAAAAAAAAGGSGQDGGGALSSPLGGRPWRLPPAPCAGPDDRDSRASARAEGTPVAEGRCHARPQGAAWRPGAPIVESTGRRPPLFRVTLSEGDSGLRSGLRPRRPREQMVRVAAARGQWEAAFLEPASASRPGGRRPGGGWAWHCLPGSLRRGVGFVLFVCLLSRYLLSVKNKGSS